MRRIILIKKVIFCVIISFIFISCAGSSKGLFSESWSFFSDDSKEQFKCSDHMFKVKTYDGPIEVEYNYGDNLFITELLNRDVQLKFDLSKQVLNLDVPKDDTYDPYLYPSIRSIDQDSSYRDSRLGDKVFVPTAVVLAKLKEFNDGLYAAIELLLQNGSKTFVGKKSLLESLANMLAENNNIDYIYQKEFINSAASLGAKYDFSAEEIASFENKYGFKKNHLKSIGFYTWSEELEKIFRQDRLLQKEFTSDQAKEIIGFDSLLKSDSQINDEYSRYLVFLQHLTNGFPDNYNSIALDSTGIKKSQTYCFFPPCRSSEANLDESLSDYELNSESFSLMDKMIAKIRSREIDLKPTDESGWYDYQQFSYEPFLIPDSMVESNNLNFSKRYKKDLEQLFKTAMALTRETHIKNLLIPKCSSDVDSESRYLKTIYITVNPNLRYEPNMTFYKRSAESYRYIRKALTSFFDESDLKSVSRQNRNCKTLISLYDELLYIENLTYGIYYLTAERIGTKINYDHSCFQVDEYKRLALDWAKNIKDDKDIAFDNRMMVPVSYDVAIGKYKVWAFLGYQVKNLNVSYRQKPSYRIINKKDDVDIKVKYENDSYRLLVPITEEFWVDTLMNRDEFRNICDLYKKRGSILKFFGKSKLSFKIPGSQKVIVPLKMKDNSIFQQKLDYVQVNKTLIPLNGNKSTKQNSYTLKLTDLRIKKQYVYTFLLPIEDENSESYFKEFTLFEGDVIPLGTVECKNEETGKKIIKTLLAKVVKSELGKKVIFNLANNSQYIEYDVITSKFRVLEEL